MKTGSGVDGELTFLDVLSILSFFIGVQNLDMNVEDIHIHLQKQDEKIDHIIEVIENDKDKGSG